eukprot:GHVH01011969.1.p1 GENE.GHVH01011969.1~~GHVH01011969.1.p1  ORF type:complete len:140 (+),score=25.10 GHVH01011969.1:45-422(+)
MSAAVKVDSKIGQETGLDATDAQSDYHIRLTLTSPNLKSLEDVSAAFMRRCQKHSKKVTGPVRLPVKKLTITTRRSPCGEGTNTWDKFELRLYKRIIDVKTTTDFIKSVTDIFADPSIDVEVTFP